MAWAWIKRSITDFRGNADSSGCDAANNRGDSLGQTERDSRQLKPITKQMEIGGRIISIRRDRHDIAFFKSDPSSGRTTRVVSFAR